MEIKEKFYIAKSFLALADNNFLLVQNVLEENIKQGNVPWVTGWGEISERELNEKIKWSDINIFPILFNFYHSLELLMKGFLILADNYEIKQSHNFEKIFNNFQKYYQVQEINNILSKYLNPCFMPNLLSEWMKENQINATQLHEFLEYPYDIELQKKLVI